MEHEHRINFVTLSGMDSPKPLICESFRQARVIALHLLRRRRSGGKTLFDAVSQSSSPGISYSSVSLEHNNNNNNNNNNNIIISNSSSESSSNIDDETARLRLFLCTPSVAEPRRYSQKGLLNETESLQLKHSVEYEFLVPAIGMALNTTIAAHEVWKKQQEELCLRRCSVGDELPSALLHTNCNSAGTGAENEDGNNNNNNNNNERNSRELFAAFETTEVPNIPLQEYVRRMPEYAYVSPSILLIACLYLDRLLTQHSSLLLSPGNIFKLLATAIRVASKVMDTRTLNNKDFARISGLGNTEMNVLEMRFMQALELDLFVGSDDFYKYAEDLIAPSVSNSNRDSQDGGNDNTVAAPLTSSDPATAQKRFLVPIHRTNNNANNSNSNNNNNNNNNSTKRPKTFQDTLPPVNTSRLITPMDSQTLSPSKSSASTATVPGIIGVGFSHAGKGNNCSTTTNTTNTTNRTNTTNTTNTSTTLSCSRSTTTGLPVPAPPRRASCLPVGNSRNSSGVVLCSMSDSNSARVWDRNPRDRVEERLVR